MASGNGTAVATEEFDVVVVGAGFAGMYLVHKLRGLGLSTRVLETGSDVGGTWYWNRYPGARCDIHSVYYSYSWDPELEQWEWSEKYAPQPEILAYAQHVADKHDLRRDIDFDTKVTSAEWDAVAKRWHVHTATGRHLAAKHYVMATGCLSVPKEVDIEGTDRFQGDVYFTSRWPHEGVDFTGKRVAVIGTGSSAIQSIPIIAKQAAQLTVFQRTPNFSMPANNGPNDPEILAQRKADPVAFREACRWSLGGVPMEMPTESALAVPEEQRLAAYEEKWANGGIITLNTTFIDHATSVEANDLLAEFVRNKIRSVVTDPEVAETLCPTNHPIGTKRMCVDTNYYQTYNLPHVRLVDLRKTPITTITEAGVDVTGESMTFDAIVFATGFDAMTGAMVSVDITGRGGITLKEAWENGPMTYLGLMAEGFPNLFMITGPGSPSVLSNMMVSIEQHVDWVTDTIAFLRAEGSDEIEPTHRAVAGWVQHVNDVADITLYPQANSWYMGANVPGKPRVFLPYAGGVDKYRAICDEVAAQGYLGFVRRGGAGTKVRDGVIRRVQPDVAVLLEMMGTMDIPALESMSAPDARAFGEAMSAQRPQGPNCGEIVDGTYPGADGSPLAYRLYRPSTPGPHPVVVYYHGGGWVLGSAVSDDPYTRDLCVRSNAVVISVDYRHAPEARFPAAVDDAYAALTWVADNAAALGGIPGQLVVSGWSAGANLAAVVSQQSRDRGGPAIAGQVLLTPVTDGAMDTASYVENSDGYVLTAPLMHWFFDHYVDPKDRLDPRVAPIRAEDLSGLPPAFILTAELDPLRDEGAAYARALADAGTPATHVQARGHTHTTITAVDVMPSGAPYRAKLAEAIARFLGAVVNA